MGGPRDILAPVTTPQDATTQPAAEQRDGDGPLRTAVIVNPNRVTGVDELRAAIDEQVTDAGWPAPRLARDDRGGPGHRAGASRRSTTAPRWCSSPAATARSARASRVWPARTCARGPAGRHGQPAGGEPRHPHRHDRRACRSPWTAGGARSTSARSTVTGVRGHGRHGARRGDGRRRTDRAQGPGRRARVRVLGPQAPDRRRDAGRGPGRRPPGAAPTCPQRPRRQRRTPPGRREPAARRRARRAARWRSRCWRRGTSGTGSSSPSACSPGRHRVPNMEVLRGSRIVVTSDRAAPAPARRRRDRPVGHPRRHGPAGRPVGLRRRVARTRSTSERQLLGRHGQAHVPQDAVQVVVGDRGDGLRPAGDSTTSSRPVSMCAQRPRPCAGRRAAG